MQPKRILIVENDRSTALNLERSLGDHGYRTRVAFTGRAARDEFPTFGPDLTIVDSRLPDQDALGLLGWMRAHGRLPIVVLEDDAGIAERVRIFDCGADDLVSRGLHPLELLARIQALLRRAEAPAPERLRVGHGPIEIDVPGRRVTRHGVTLKLRRIEFDLLHFLVLNAGIVVSRERLLSEVWGRAGEVFHRTVDTHIRRLRAKLEPAPDRPRFIHTVRGAGYRLECESPE